MPAFRGTISGISPRLLPKCRCPNDTFRRLGCIAKLISMIDRRVIAHLLVGLFLLGMFYWAMRRPAWEKQFKATGEALEKAKSFQLTVVTKQPNGESFEIAQEAYCPGDFHSLQKHYTKDGAIIPATEVEIWSVGKIHRLRQNENLMDTHEKLGSPPCGTQYLLELSPMLNHQLIYLKGHGERGSKKTVDSKSCREWTIQMPEGNGWGELYTMCIDENNLPVEVVRRGGAIVAHASHWNEKVDLPQPPELPATSSNPQ